MNRYTAVSVSPTRIALVSQPRKQSKTVSAPQQDRRRTVTKLRRCQETGRSHPSPVGGTGSKLTAVWPAHRLYPVRSTLSIFYGRALLAMDQFFR